MRIQLRHLHGLFDEAVQAVGLLVDDVEQLVARGLVQRRLREQRGDGRLDRGERGAQLVGDGVEQRGAQALGLLGGFGAGAVFQGLGALNGHGDQPAERLHGLARQGDRLQQQRAGGTYTDAQGNGRRKAVGGRAKQGLQHGFAQVADDLDAAALGVAGGAGDDLGVRLPRHLGTGDALGVGEIDAVVVGDVQRHRRAVEGVGDAGGDEVEELGDVFRLQELAAQAVEHLRFAAARVGFVTLLADARGQVAGVDGGAQEGEQRHPVLGVGDGEGADGRQEEVVERDGGGNGCADGVAQAPVSCENQHQQQQGKRDGGVVGVNGVMVEQYNTRERRRNDQPARGLDNALGVHTRNCTEQFRC